MKRLVEDLAGTPLVLLVGLDEDTCRDIRRLCATVDAAVTSVSTGLDACRFISCHHWDAVVVATDLPDLDVVQRAVRKHMPQRTVTLVSPSDTDSVALAVRRQINECDCSVFRKTVSNVVAALQACHVPHASERSLA